MGKEQAAEELAETNGHKKPEQERGYFVTVNESGQVQVSAQGGASPLEAPTVLRMAARLVEEKLGIS